MNAIKERLLEMKKEHLIGEDDNVSSPSISYEEVDRGF